MTRYISLPEYLWLAEQVTGNPAGDLAKAGRIDLAESALHAPEAAFGGEDFYTTLVDKAALGSFAATQAFPQGLRLAAAAEPRVRTRPAGAFDSSR